MNTIFFSNNKSNQSSDSKKTAVILGAFLALTALASILYLCLAPTRDSDRSLIRITKDGTVIREIPFSDITESYEFTVTDENGSYNTIRISSEGVQVTEASCPDKICIRTGNRKDSLLPIICLPNHLVIEIITEDGLSEMDAVTY